jgi:hypothetical protein
MIRFPNHWLALASALLSLSLVSTAPAATKPAVEVAFVLDTTGSMASLIEGAKRKIWSIATTIIDENPGADIRMGLVAYRDIGDEYVTKRVELTADIQDLYARLLELRARGGGDWPESVNEALHEGITRLAWTQGPEVSRIIFLVGDAPPHMDYAQDVKYPDALKIAREREIVVNAVQAGEARDTFRVWKEIAQMGNGAYIPIPQDGGRVVVIETPFDVEIIELQERLNGTVLPYGPRYKKSSVEQKTRQAAAAPAPMAADMAGYLNRQARYAPASSGVITGDGDLVADVTAGRQDLAKVKEDELPDALRSLKPEERQEAIAKRLGERGKLNERMTELVRKRDAFVAEQQKKQVASGKPADSFDRAVQSTLRAQIKR